MKTLFRRFCEQDHGGVTVDWIFLTGGCLSLAFAVLATITISAKDVANDTRERIAAVEIGAG